MPRGTKATFDRRRGGREPDFGEPHKVPISEQLQNWIPAKICQALITSAVVVGEFAVIEP